MKNSHPAQGTLRTSPADPRKKIARAFDSLRKLSIRAKKPTSESTG